MPSAAPVPDDVVRVTLEFNVGDLRPTIGFWLWNPGLGPLDASTLEDLVGAFILSELDDVLHLMHDGVTFSACTALSAGLRVVEGFAFAAGVWTGGQAEGITVGLHWLDGKGRRSSAALTHLPGCPDAFIDANVRLSQIGWGNLRDHGGQLLTHLAEHSNGSGGLLVPIILHRRGAGGPLPVAEPVPIVAVVPMLKVSTIGRRLSSARGIPPT